MKPIVTKSTLLFFFISWESHLNAVLMNSLRNQKEACFVDLEQVSRPAMKPNDYLTVLHSRLVALSLPFPHP